jgi:hypothetical protein
MKLITRPIAVISIFVSIILLGGCKTEDVTPLVTLEVAKPFLDITSGKLDVYASLNGTVSNDVVVSIAFGGDAQKDIHYRTSSNEITIEKGNTSGYITLTGIPSGDTILKTIIISITSVENGLSLNASRLEILMIDCSGDKDGDGILDCDDECPDEPGPPENNGCPWLGLIINEVHYDPAGGLAGDANGDGVRDPLEDEFAELYNDGPALDISGYTLSDAAMVRHTFPNGTIIPSNGVIVVFGGGTPTGNFGNAIVQIATEGQLNLNNAGDKLILKDETGKELALFDITPLDSNPDEAYSRDPDIKGEFKKHSLIPGANGALYSPGTKNDGSNF